MQTLSQRYKALMMGFIALNFIECPIDQQSAFVDFADV